MPKVNLQPSKNIIQLPKWVSENGNDKVLIQTLEFLKTNPDFDFENSLDPDFVNLDNKEIFIKSLEFIRKFQIENQKADPIQSDKEKISSKISLGKIITLLLVLVTIFLSPLEIKTALFITTLGFLTLQAYLDQSLPKIEISPVILDKPAGIAKRMMNLKQYKN